MNIRKILIISILLFGCWTLQSKGLYVSPTGLDTNTGAIDNPLKTIKKALGKVAPGDTVYLRAGRFEETVWPIITGTAAKPIVITGYANEKAIVTPNYSSWDAFGFDPGIEYYVVQNIEIPSVTRVGFNVSEAAHITIRNCIVHDCLWQAIWADINSHDLLIENCTIYNNVGENANHKANSWRSAINFDGKNSVIKGCIIYKNNGEGLGLYGDGNKAINNTLHDNWSVNIYLCNTINATCESNYIYSENDPNYYRTLYNRTGPAWGIMLSNEGSTRFLNSNTVINNIVVGGIAPLFYWRGNFPSGLVNCVIANNLFVNGMVGCAMIENNQHSNTKIYNNIFYQTINTNEILEQSSMFGTDTRLDLSNNFYSGKKYYDGSSKYGKNVFSGDPVFQSAILTAPYKYQTDSLSSQCVDNGIDYTQKSTIDFGGLARVKGTIDIGPFETQRQSSAIHEVGENSHFRIGRLNGVFAIYSDVESEATIELYTLNAKLIGRYYVTLNKGMNRLKEIKTTVEGCILKLKLSKRKIEFSKVLL